MLRYFFEGCNAWVARGGCVAAKPHKMMWLVRFVPSEAGDIDGWLAKSKRAWT